MILTLVIIHQFTLSLGLKDAVRAITACCQGSQGSGGAIANPPLVCTRHITMDLSLNACKGCKVPRKKQIDPNEIVDFHLKNICNKNVSFECTYLLLQSIANLVCCIHQFQNDKCYDFFVDGFVAYGGSRSLSEATFLEFFSAQSASHLKQEYEILRLIEDQLSVNYIMCINEMVRI